MKHRNDAGQTVLLWEGQPIVLLRSDRRTVGLEINRELCVLVRAPRYMSEEVVLRFIESKRAWLQAHTERLRAQRAANDMRPFTQDEIAALLTQAREQLPSRVEYFAREMGVDYRRITVRSQVSRFGSCTAQGNLSFNCLLLAMPRKICDYVIVHELCHRREMNHSAAFWREVEAVLPDYRERRLWLRENGAVLIERLRQMRQNETEKLCDLDKNRSKERNRLTAEAKSDKIMAEFRERG